MSALCNLRVLCASVVGLCRRFIHHRGTENTEIAQRRTEKRRRVHAYFCALLSRIVIPNDPARDPSADFGELGKQLLGGFILAVIIAVAFTFLRLRLRDNKPPAEFISISRVKGPDEPAKVAHD
jgi:hypothetical protein